MFHRARDLLRQVWRHGNTVYEEFLRKFEAQQEVHVFLHLRALSKPHVSDEDRYTISRTFIPNCYRLTVRHGYNDRVISADLGDVVYHELRKAIVKMVDYQPLQLHHLARRPSLNL